MRTADSTKGRAAAFLREHRMYYEDLDREAALAAFLADMDSVFHGGSGTTKMIPTYVGDYHAPAADEAVAVLDIGGTNVRGAIAVMGRDGLKELRRLQPFLTPGVEQETDTAGFYGEIAARVSADPVWQDWFSGTDDTGSERDLSRGMGGVDDQPDLSHGMQAQMAHQDTAKRARIKKIGICFSLATVPQRDRDAVMVAGGKQIKIRDMLGKKVGESFREGLYAADPRSRETKLAITVINDSVAAALGGYSLSGSEKYSGCLGFIYGTGTNLCYREPTSETVNVEAGAYCGFPTGDMDDAFDATLIDVGDDRFEKMVSGGYQGGLMTQVLAQAVQEGYLSKGWARDGLPADLTSRDISAFSADPTGDNRLALCCKTDEDRSFLRELFDLLTMRSACLCSMVLTGGLLRAGIGKAAKQPAFITMEGSTYLKQHRFKEMLEEQMASYAGARYGLHYSCQVVPDVIFRGTAVAALSR